MTKQKFDIGHKFDNWEVINFNPMLRESGSLTYQCKCIICNNQRTFTSSQIGHPERIAKCLKCREISRITLKSKQIIKCKHCNQLVQTTNGKMKFCSRKCSHNSRNKITDYEPFKNKVVTTKQLSFGITPIHNNSVLTMPPGCRIMKAKEFTFKYDELKKLEYAVNIFISTQINYHFLSWFTTPFKAVLWYHSDN